MYLYCEQKTMRAIKNYHLVSLIWSHYYAQKGITAEGVSIDIGEYKIMKL